MTPIVAVRQPPSETLQGSSLMVCTLDQRIVWVSDEFAGAIGRQPDQLVGLAILGLLDGADHDTWAELFDGPGSSQKRFDHLVVHVVGQTESVDRFELRRLRTWMMAPTC